MAPNNFELQPKQKTFLRTKHMISYHYMYIYREREIEKEGQREREKEFTIILKKMK